MGTEATDAAGRGISREERPSGLPRDLRQPGLLRRLTARQRALPDIVIVGAQRAGTTSLYNYLVQHPAVQRALWKEVHFFDRSENYERGPAWYRAHFPTRSALHASERRTGERGRAIEGTPAYLYRPEVAERMAHLLPGARLIAILRDPVERALSAYKNVSRKGRTHIGLDDALERDLAWIDRGAGLEDGDEPRPYVRRGLYALQLENLFRHFARERVLVLSAEEMFSDPQRTCQRAFTFAGLSPHAVDGERVHNRSDVRGVLGAEVRTRLEAFYRPHNRRLYELLGRSFGWPA